MGTAWRTAWQTWGGLALTAVVTAIIDIATAMGWVRPAVAVVLLSAVVVAALVREYLASIAFRRFLGQVAHEVGNPAAIIQHALERWYASGRATSEQADIAFAATRRLVRTARQVQQILQVPAMPEAPAVRVTTIEQGGPRVRLLIIDDEDDLRAVLQESALAHGWETSAAASVDDAFALLDGGLTVDVVVCDLMMPDGGAERWLRDSRTRYPALAARTIVITGGATSAAALSLATAAPDRLLYKPFSMSDLHDLARRLTSLPESRQF
jgi:CheY-like chemotaxis protein